MSSQSPQTRWRDVVRDVTVRRQAVVSVVTLVAALVARAAYGLARRSMRNPF